MSEPVVAGCRQETGYARAGFSRGLCFLKDDAFQRCLRECSVLFLGGDTRCGLGKIRQVSWTPLRDDQPVFDATVTYHENGPVLRTERILGHEKICREAPGAIDFGMQEIVGGWNINSVFADCLSWAPGSKTAGDVCWCIDRFGYWSRHAASHAPEA